MLVNKVSWEHNPAHSLVIIVHGCVPATAAEIAEMEPKGPYICSLALYGKISLTPGLALLFITIHLGAAISFFSLVTCYV